MTGACGWMGLAVGALVGAGVVSGCGRAADGAEADGAEAAGAITCGAGEVALAGECLACDAARIDVRERLEANIVERGWGSCSSDADCHSQEWSTPCDGQCNVAIAEDSRAAFEAELGEFVSGVCDPGRWRPSCGGPRDVDCAVDAHCSAGSCRIGGVSCGGLSEGSCAGDAHCRPIRARPYDDAAGCFSSEPVFVGCGDIGVSCRPQISLGIAADGLCFAFGDCLASGFELAPRESPCQAAVGNTCDSGRP